MLTCVEVNCVTDLLLVVVELAVGDRADSIEVGRRMTSSLALTRSDAAARNWGYGETLTKDCTLQDITRI